MKKRSFLVAGLTALLGPCLPRFADAQQVNLGPLLPHAGLELTTAFSNSYGA